MDNDYKKAKKRLKVFYIIPIFAVLILVVVVIYLFSSSIFGSADSNNSTSTLQPTTSSGDVVVSPTIGEGSVNDEGQSIDSGEDLQETDVVAVPADKLRTVFPILLEEYFPNPGMGWIYEWGVSDTNEPGSTLRYSHRTSISWDILNPSEGVYNWEPLDSQLNKTVSEGKQFSFRVFTMIGEEFGGQVLPEWVIDKGAVINSIGEPDYSNCVYQEEWGKFVNELVSRYDGNLDVAFIDISGYGNFNEWGWSDEQTTWDDVWDEHYWNDEATAGDFRTLDGQARRILADMFIGGSYSGHQCREESGGIKRVDYNYGGFQNTQLVLPYAGILQSTQYVFTQRKDVGFRFDSLGRSGSVNIIDDLGDEISVIYKKAPIVYETASYDRYEMEYAYYLLENTHGSIVHNVNVDDMSAANRMGLAEVMGYRYYLEKAQHLSKVDAGGNLYLNLHWLNIGNSPSYSLMGQKFELHFFLVDEDDNYVVDIAIKEDINKWLPSSEFGGEPPSYQVERNIKLPEDMPDGVYQTKVAILDQRTGEYISLAMDGREDEGWYPLSEIIVGNP